MLAFSAATLLREPMTATGPEVDSALQAIAETDAGSVTLWTLHAAAAGNDKPDRRRMRTRLDELGLSTTMLEACTAWTSSDVRAIDDEVDTTIAWADALGAEYVLAVTLGSEYPEGRAVAVEGLGRMCDRTAAAGLAVVVEFLPWSAVGDLVTADRLVADVGRPNLGILLDCWHWSRQAPGPELGLLDQVDLTRIQVVQLCDSGESHDDDLMAEAMTGRLLPGEGQSGVPELVKAMHEARIEPIWAPEVFSHALLQHGQSAMARQVVDASRRVLL